MPEEQYPSCPPVSTYMHIHNTCHIHIWAPPRHDTHTWIGVKRQIKAVRMRKQQENHYFQLSISSFTFMAPLDCYHNIPLQTSALSVGRDQIWRFVEAMFSRFQGSLLYICTLYAPWGNVLSINVSMQLCNSEHDPSQHRTRLGTRSSHLV